MELSNTPSESPPADTQPDAPQPTGHRWQIPAYLKTSSAIALQIGGTLAAIGLVTAALLWNTLFAGMPQLPGREELWSLNRNPAVEFVDVNDNTIAVRGAKYGRAVSAADLPPYVVNAFVAAEDQHFRKHAGVDLRSIVRAATANALAGHTVQGGSTITQQLVKNLFFDQEQTIKRKAQEARLAGDLERMLSKDEILDLYLNRIYLGANAYGIDAAARTYFGKAPEDLTLGEAALLAGFPKAPTRMAARRTEASVRERQHYVLDQMVKAGFVTATDAIAARGEQLTFAQPPEDVFTGHALDFAMQQLHELVPNAPPDVVVKLTLNLDLQAKTEQAVETSLATAGKAKHVSEGAAVLMDSDGAIRAMVGGRDYGKSHFNRATQAMRQPGSAFKPFVYAAALEAGLTPWTIRTDAPIQIGKWRPRNFGGEYAGDVTLTNALVRSLNTVAAQVCNEIGPANVVELAHRFGIVTPLHNYPSIALGTDEVNLLELTGGYGVFARRGMETSPYIIAEVRNSKGDVLYSHAGGSLSRAYSEDLADKMTGMLNSVVRYGTGRGAQVAGWDVAGKTGTSQSSRDAWFIGYTTRFVAGVWVGNDNDKPMLDMTGGAIPAVIFSRIMTAAVAGLQPEPLPGVLAEPPQEEEADDLEAMQEVSLDSPLDESTPTAKAEIPLDLPEKVAVTTDTAPTL